MGVAEEAAYRKLRAYCTAEGIQLESREIRVERFQATHHPSPEEELSTASLWAEEE